MSSILPRPILEVEYAHAARVYQAGLPPEHYMEAIPQATQREITVASFALVRRRREDFHYFNELLVQYPYGPGGKIHQVVPDNMVVLHPGPIKADGSYDLPLQPVGPLVVLEYVSKSSKRKDYEDNFLRYERQLKVPYYLLFYPETQDLSLFRRGARKYVSVKPNEAGRLAISEVDLEVALLDGWARFWFHGEPLPLPAELQQNLDEAREQLRLAQDQTRLAQEGQRLAQERERLAQQREDQQRLQNERLLAQLRELGIDPRL